jgi:hypothetical protein
VSVEHGRVAAPPIPLATRRRKGGPDIEPVYPAPAPAIETWASALLEALAPCVGSRVSFASGPELEDHMRGPWAFRFELASERGPLPPAWRGQLTLRLGDGDAELRREEAAIRLCAAHDIGVPTVLALVDLGPSQNAGSELRATHALITRVPDLVWLPELIGFNASRGEALLRGFARAHVAVHGCDARELEASVPILSLAEELARIDERRFGAELAWLRDNAPPPAPNVLCHGNYQPFCVVGPGPASWDEVGGPGCGLITSNWCTALIAEREFDVGFTLVAFWMAPFFVRNRSERTAIKLIRNTLSNQYRLGYMAAAPIDRDRVRFWQAFHAVRGMARLADAYDYQGSPFSAPERGSLPNVIAPQLERLFKMQHRG